MKYVVLVFVQLLWLMPAYADLPEFEVHPRVRQLFLDDFGIESMKGLRRVVNSATRHPANPVLRREDPWEQFRVTRLTLSKAKAYSYWFE